MQFDFLVKEKIADGALIAKWRKPGYEILCSMLAIQKGNHNFGTTSHCRYPCEILLLSLGSPLRVSLRIHMALSGFTPAGAPANLICVLRVTRS